MSRGLSFVDLTVGEGAPSDDIRALIELRRATVSTSAASTRGLLYYTYLEHGSELRQPGVDHVDLLSALPLGVFARRGISVDRALMLLGEGHNMLVLRTALAEERIAQLSDLLHEYGELNYTLRERLEALERDVARLEREVQP